MDTKKLKMTFKSSFSNDLPKRVLKRGKHGFAIPIQKILSEKFFESKKNLSFHEKISPNLQWNLKVLKVWENTQKIQKY